MPDKLNFKRDRYCLKDGLGFAQYIDVLAEMIRAENFETPFCIGLYGKWGSGKTSFMHLLEEKLKENGNGPPHPITVWFNPWRYEKEEHLIIPFLKTLEQAVLRYCEKHEKTKLKNFVATLRQGAGKIGRVAAALAYGMKLDCKLAGIGLSLDASKATDREEKLDQQNAEASKAYSESLSSIYYDIIGALEKAVDKDKFRIVVFIDDLDRCLPEKALELLESIKLFLDLEGYLFLLGVDREVVEQGINYHYRFYEKAEGNKEEKQPEAGAPKKLIISSADYLDKMIQMPFELPPMEPTRKRQFIETLLENSAYKDEAELIEAGIGDNPRSLTRFINFMAFMGRLAERLKGKILDETKGTDRQSKKHRELLNNYFTPHFYVKWAIIVFRYRDEHDKIKNNWHRVIDIQDSARMHLDKTLPESELAKAKDIKILLPEPLRKVLAEGDPFPDDPWLIQKFIHLATAVKVAATERNDLPKNEKAAGLDQRALPVIGAIVKIPRGPFLYGDDKKPANIDNNFEIDVYPVTNGQYRKFINEGGYTGEQDHYWSKAGLAWRKKNQISEPEYWQEEKWNKADHPVVGVSYFEAEAYSAWAQKRLPTEEEWEKAARGDNGRVYPWGDEFDPAKCNTAETNKDATTPVTAYPDGASPYGCFDMAGNVWEWTDSWNDKDEDARVLRGGSWNDSHGVARCAFRGRYYPFDRFYNVGFRCARAV